ncbi:isopentenyl-diphosphate delta-isomerase [Candidatus Peregrinibacteria bacterium CG10_big_fil_rev_8_21_14_0_10_49_24]|nr:MAG: isopentenyl-diphosphate delta-isomerase [Candidatus Peregrinibacteria bacterium CG10_big_fil_rev_8_21_14_0_10_49_24]
MREVILTDSQGNDIGLAEIIDAHTGEGKLHKAFSVYIFGTNGNEILIQQRSGKKMLFPLVWANTCCSHPFPGEGAQEAGMRRLQEECGLSCTLEEAGTLIYKAQDPNGNGVEHEHVTLLKGYMDSQTVPNPHPDEIEDIRWINVDDVLREMADTPEKYAPWFHLGLKQLL